MQSEPPDYDIPHTAAATTANTADHNADYDILGDSNAEERAATRETADTPQAQTTTAITADNKAECDIPGELDVKTLAKASSSTADSNADERAATRETADTPQAQTITAITADNKAECDTLGEQDVYTLAKAS
jgi:hypothetical protein